MPLVLNVIRKKKFCVLQKKVLSFGPNRTVEVQPNSSAEPNVRSITTNNLSGLNDHIKLDNITGLNDLDSLFGLKKTKNCFHFTYCVIFLATGTSTASVTSTASRTSVTSMTSTASFHQKTWGT